MCLREGGGLSTARGRVTTQKEEREGVGDQEDSTRDPNRDAPKIWAVSPELVYNQTQDPKPAFPACLMSGP